MGKGQGRSRSRPRGMGLGEELERGCSRGCCWIQPGSWVSGFLSCKEKSDLQIIIVAAVA